MGLFKEKQDELIQEWGIQERKENGEGLKLDVGCWMLGEWNTDGTDGTDKNGFLK